MNALLLPGNSPRHEAWIERLRAAVAPQFDATITQHYRHWQTGEPQADRAYELHVAATSVEDFDDYLIIAKSVGTFIAVEGTARGVLKPSKLILLGLPLFGDLPHELFVAWMHDLKVPVTVIQNTSDPLGSFRQIKDLVDQDNVTFVEQPGDTHEYLDFAAIANHI